MASPPLLPRAKTCSSVRVSVLLIGFLGKGFSTSAIPSSYITNLQFVRQGSSAIKREIFS